MRNIAIIFLMLTGIFNVSALDLTLKDCRDMALQSDENIKIAENNLTASGLDRYVARTAYLPDFSVNGTAVYRLPDT